MSIPLKQDHAIKIGGHVWPYNKRLQINNLCSQWNTVLYTK
jgi:hypothetical protein